MREVADIIWLDEVESTNSEARRRLADIDNMSVIAARTQTAGRGQGDHRWCSEPGANLTFSVVMKPESLPAEKILLITQFIAASVSRYLESKGLSPRIKWPNDIYVGDRKICGILIENILSGRNVSSSIIGVGLNINQTTFPDDLPNPVSLAQLTGQRYDPEAELLEIMGEMKKSALMLDSQQGRIELDGYFFARAFNIPEGQR